MNQNQENPLTDIALGYASHGLHVFPVKANKTPLTSHGFHEATTDPDTIRRLFASSLAVQIGLYPAPSNLAVLDIDVKGTAEGDEELADLIATHGDFTMGAPTSITPSDGSHIFFAHPGGIISNRKPSPSIDVRADKGYVILPPSPDYKWELGYEGAWCNECPAEHPLFESLPVFPEALTRVAMIREVQPSSDSAPIYEGDRHATLFSLGSKLRYQGVPRDGIEASLRAVNRDRCQPPLSEARLLAEIEGVLTAEAPINPTSPPSGFPTWKWSNEIDPNFKMDWYPGWEDFIPKGSTTLIAGDEKVGKSKIGISLLAEHSKTGETGLYLTAEGIETEIAAELTLLGSKLDRIGIIHSRISLDMDTGINWLTEQVAMYRPTFLVLDPLSSFLGGDRGTLSEKARIPIDVLNELGNKFGLTSVVIHHWNQNPAASTKDRSSGHKQINAAVSSVLYVGSDPNRPERGSAIAQVEGRYAKKVDSRGFTFVEHENGTAIIKWIGKSPITSDHMTAVRARIPTKKNAARDWLRNLLEDGPLSSDEIREEAKEEKFSWRTIERIADEVADIPKWGPHYGKLWFAKGTLDPMYLNAELSGAQSAEDIAAQFDAEVVT